MSIKTTENSQKKKLERQTTDPVHAERHESVTILIIGSGAAGLTAAIYAARAGYQPVILNGPQPGGQLTITSDVENYPGYKDPVSGPFLMEQMTEQAKRFGTVLVDEWATDFQPGSGTFESPHRIICESGLVYEAPVVIIASGASAKWLGLPSESEFNGRGVSACATCDGFFFRNQDVAVVGGGNTAVEEAVYLSNIAKSVTLIHRRTSLRAEKIMIDRLLAKPNIKISWNGVVEEILGDSRGVNSVRVRDVSNGKAEILNVTGVFIAIGHEPSTQAFKAVLEMDSHGYLICSPGSVKTNLPGVFAAGDCVDKIYRQAVTAAGMGCMAALDAKNHLEEFHD